MDDIKFHIGTSSFRESRWKGVFYPEDLPSKEYFNYYTQHFDTYEINGTFYRFPTLRVLSNWYERSPEHFKFSVKAPKTITHLKKFVDCEKEIAEFYAVCSAGLQDKLGPILFQLPPSFSFTSERLELICQSLNPAYSNVVEFRNVSWWNLEVDAEFKKSGISFCNVSYHGLPDSIIQTSEILYFRFHGNEKLFYSGYDTDFLQRKIDEITTKYESAKAYIYFNNTASTEGILNAIMMKALLNQ